MSTRLTRRQNEIRLRGLRILARIIARAHLASLRQAESRRNGFGEDIPRREDGHAE